MKATLNLGGVKTKGYKAFTVCCAWRWEFTTNLLAIRSEENRVIFLEFFPRVATFAH